MPLRVAGLVFAPHPIPTLAAVAMVALTVSLGNWQSGRAREKATLQALLEKRAGEAPLVLTGAAGGAEELRFRRVRARGRFVADGQVFVDNRIHGGRAGFHVVTPLAIAGSQALLLVNRGWIARTAAYPAPPEAPVPSGDVTVEGLATVPPARVLELSGATVTGSVWQNLSTARYAAQVRRDVLPVVLLAAPPGPGLAAVAEKPDTGIAKHHEYSLTWYSLALTVVALWVGLNLRRHAP